MWRGRCLLITNPARGRAGKSWGKPPSPVPPPWAEGTAQPNLPATKVTQTCIPQEVERKSRCSSLMVLEGSVSLAMVSWMGTGPSMSARSPQTRRWAVVAAVTSLLAGQMRLRFTELLTQEKLWGWHSPVPASAPQTRCSNPSYLRGRALRQHLGTGWFEWTFGKVQPTPH